MSLPGGTALWQGGTGGVDRTNDQPQIRLLKSARDHGPGLPKTLVSNPQFDGCSNRLLGMQLTTPGFAMTFQIRAMRGLHVMAGLPPHLGLPDGYGLTRWLRPLQETRLV